MKEIYEKVRIVVVGICILAATLKLLHLPGGSFLLIIGMGLLIIIHLVYAFAEQEATWKQTLIHYISNFSVAIITAGVLFQLMHWSNGKLILWTGLIFAVVSYGISFLISESDKKQ